MNFHKKRKRYGWNSGNSLSGCNGIRTENHLVCKRTFTHLAKLAVWINGWVFAYELASCWLESRWRHLNFRYCTSFEQGVPWHSGNYRVLIHSKNAYMTWWEQTAWKQCLSIHLIKEKKSRVKGSKKKTNQKPQQDRSLRLGTRLKQLRHALNKILVKELSST